MTRRTTRIIAATATLGLSAGLAVATTGPTATAATSTTTITYTQCDVRTNASNPATRVGPVFAWSPTFTFDMDTPVQVNDEVVGRALAALHGRPAHPWTLDELAQKVGASRSVLAARFMDFVGVPPIQYLAQWRMQLAGTMLAGPSTLGAIAEAVGYGSEAAFSRAFKKIVGVPPATWRTMRASEART